MKLTLNSAAKEAGVSKSTLSDALRNGRLSAEKDDRGRYQIDPAELFRVFPRTGPDEQPEPKPNDAGNRENRGLEQEVEALHRQIESLNREREREREQLSDQIADLRQRLDQESQERRSLTAMITDQRAQAAPSARRNLLGFLGLGRRQSG